MDAIKTVVKGAGWTFLGYCISKFLNYLYRVLIARISPDAYGELSIGIAIFGIFSLFSIIGLNLGVTRFVAFYQAKKDFQRVKGIINVALLYACSMSLFLAFLLYLFSDYIASLYKADFGIIFRIFAVAIPFYAIREIILSVLRGFQYAKYEVLIRMFSENLVKIMITYILLLFGFAAAGAAFAHMLAIIATTLLSFYILEYTIFPLFHTKVNALTDKALKNELLMYSFPAMLSTLIAQVFVWSDLLMLGIFRDVYEVGIYNAALPTATLTSILPGAIISLFLPVMTDLYARNNKGEFVKTYRSCAKWIFFGGLHLYMFMILFSKEILSLVFGSVYGAGGTALSILIIGYIVYHIFTPSLELLNVQKKTHIVMINTIIASSVNILLNYFLIPPFGMIGGAIATTASMSLLGILELCEVWHYNKMQPIQRSFWKGTVAGVASILAIFFIFPSLPEKLIYSVPLAFILNTTLYFLILLMLKAYDETDLELFTLIKRKITRILLPGWVE